MPNSCGHHAASSPTSSNRTMASRDALSDKPPAGIAMPYFIRATRRRRARPAMYSAGASMAAKWPPLAGVDHRTALNAASTYDFGG